MTGTRKRSRYSRQQDRQNYHERLVQMAVDAQLMKPKEAKRQSTEKLEMLLTQPQLQPA